MMPIDNRLTSGVSPGSPQSSALSRSAPLVPAGQEKSRVQSTFPDSPRISVQPLRYNTQLNYQLTRVQQAGDFVSRLEDATLSLRHAITRRGTAGEIAGRTAVLQQLLADRVQASGGSVDRQLRVNLESDSRVAFQLGEEQTLLSHPQAEVLTFALDGEPGQQRELSSVALAAGSTPQQTLLQLNRALGKWGITATLDARQQLQFDVTEAQWPRISQQLSVQGSGARYPAGQFYPLQPQAEYALEDALTQQPPPRTEHMLPLLERTLTTLTGQRQRLLHSQAKVSQRIDSMATPGGRHEALAQAQRLASQLQQDDFASQSAALRAQANVPAARVRNVLNGTR